MEWKENDEEEDRKKICICVYAHTQTTEDGHFSFYLSIFFPSIEAIATPLDISTSFREKRDTDHCYSTGTTVIPENTYTHTLVYNRVLLYNV